MRVTRLSTTPVKGLALHHPISIRVDETGAVGDRLFYLADKRPSLVSIAKGGALLGAGAATIAKRASLPVLIALTAGGYLLKRHNEKRAAREATAPTVPNTPTATTAA